MKKLVMSAEQFRRIRERDLKLTRKEFSDIFGFTQRHIRDMEKGETPIIHRTALLMVLAKKANAKGIISFK